ncbi:MAG TPA: cytosine permease [Streptosporangiaceae bacterium]|nr:cytosine permease [Streptosporangiaceae bacterium]
MSVQPDTGSTSGALSSIEERSFDHVPESERHGQPRQVFYMWFGISATIFSLVTGFVGITLGLSFWWTLLSIVIGNVLGALFMAFHAAQGPQLGLPQMIQSRAQFGYYGAILPLAITWVMYIAFLAVDIVLAGQGFQVVFGWSLNGWMAILTIPMLLLAIYGYDFINRYNKYQTWLFIAIFLGLTVYMFVHGVPHGGLTAGKFTWGAFLLSTSIVAAYQITYAPYVSDYTRYLPQNTVKKVFWRTYLATVISCVWLMGLGAAVGALNPKSSSMLLEIKHLGGPIGGVLAILMAIGLIAPNSTNVYGGMMTTLSIANNISDRVRSTRRLRIVVCFVIAVLGALVATAGAGSFMTNLENYLTVILYILIPWSVINLTDYYYLRHGQYRTADFYAKDGAFGKVNARTMIVYLIAFAIEVPFMNTTVFEGPAAKALGGGDIAWIVGAVVTVPLYLLAVRGTTRGAPGSKLQKGLPADAGR